MITGDHESAAALPKSQYPRQVVCVEAIACVDRKQPEFVEAHLIERGQHGVRGFDRISIPCRYMKKGTAIGVH
jgi:hypothetical protein